MWKSTKRMLTLILNDLKNLVLNLLLKHPKDNIEYMPRKPREAAGLTSLENQVAEQAFRIAMLEAKIQDIHMAIEMLCQGLRAHLIRIDQNTVSLKQNIDSVARHTIRPPKDLLNGNNEVN